ncbi:MAG: hypothetical protein K2X87_14835 [Gemmataceae bacterium]|nr:hypothetical protein [Gemmataceae bacterium]
MGLPSGDPHTDLYVWPNNHPHQYLTLMAARYPTPDQAEGQLTFYVRPGVCGLINGPEVVDYPLSRDTAATWAAHARAAEAEVELPPYLAITGWGTSRLQWLAAEAYLDLRLGLHMATFVTGWTAALQAEYGADTTWEAFNRIRFGPRDDGQRPFRVALTHPGVGDALVTFGPRTAGELLGDSADAAARGRLYVAF